jgi:hypothetical protein
MPRQGDPVMSMKKTIVIIGLLILVVIVYVAAGPFITLHEIKTGIQDQDSEKLSAYIDFPALRENLKEQLNAYVMKQATTELKDNPFGALGMALGAKLVDTMVDSSVTPTGLSNLAAGRKPQQGSGQKLEPFHNARYSFDSINKFSARVPEEGGGEIRFVLTRDGLSWKLTNIVVPIGAESSGSTEAGSSVNTTPAAAPSLKIEAIDTRATETNDVWTRYAWKLSVSNGGEAPGTFSVRIEWQDADGFVIDHDEEYGLSVSAHDTHTFTGDKLIDYPAASRVSKIEAKLSQ